MALSLCSARLGRPATATTRKTPLHVRASSQQSTSSPEVKVDPVINIEASAPAGTTQLSIPSGEETLRKVLVSQKVDLYDMWGKVANCGGGGSCGTCLVEVLEGAELLSERTTGEEKKLKGKPATWRLACQAIVGDGEQAGTLKVRTQPKK